jgi:hypothetical protein
MQATFHWDGVERPVADIVDEMLDECEPGLARLGATRSDLGLIDTMVNKRVCQADFALDLGERYPDPYLLASAYAKMLRHWEVFDEYLAGADTLDPVPAPDERAIVDEHLAYIGEGTHFYRLRDAMYYPAPAMEEMIRKMVERELITTEVTTQRGMLLHRLG